ncbi:hypothetical protein [Desulfotomaculum nigrificans]|uniref:hypothetical protein n=1 Tax=Desulfotomaculum nigrificans TaxID=1565 RepID=UPI0001FADF2E|nr:hypothetical protein [Desulfotomaculum nigrificans]
MKKFKNILSRLLLVFTVFCLFVSPITNLNLAEAKMTEKVRFEKQIIKDVDTLYDRAQKGITDLDSKHKDKLFKYKAAMIDEKNGNKKDVDVYETTQLYKQTEGEDGSITSYYATTIMAVPYYDDSKYKSVSDGSGGVKAYGTFYWLTNYINGIEYVDMVYVDGGWTVGDSRLTVSDRKYWYGQSGFNLDRFFVQNTSPTYTTSSFTFARTVDSSWAPISLTTKYSIGLNSSCKITHTGNGSSWVLKMENVMSAS